MGIPLTSPGIIVMNSLSLNHNPGPMQIPPVQDSTITPMFSPSPAFVSTSNAIVHFPSDFHKREISDNGLVQNSDLLRAGDHTTPIKAKSLVSHAAEAKSSDIRIFFKPRAEFQQSTPRTHATPNGVTTHASVAALASFSITKAVGTISSDHSLALPENLVIDRTLDQDELSFHRRPRKIRDPSIPDTVNRSQAPRKINDTPPPSVQIPPTGRLRQYPVSSGADIDGHKSLLSEATSNETARSPELYAGDQEARHSASTFNRAIGLSPVFTHDTSEDSQHQQSEKDEQTLVGALTSAFAGNAVPDDFDESSDFSSVSDYSVEAIKRPRRRRIALRPVPQIPTSPALRRHRQERTPKELHVTPSEKTIRKYLDVEYSSLHLPPGVSVAPENDSEYVDPEDGLLLDYDSSAEIIETRREQKRIKLDHAPNILLHNLRFVKKQTESAARGIRPSNSVRQYIVAPVSSTVGYLQRAENNFGKQALDSVRDDLPDWEFISKPRKFRTRVPVNKSYSRETTPAESSDVGEELGVNNKRPQSESPEIRKRVKFSDEVPSVSVAQSALPNEGGGGAECSGFDAILCGELLQKLTKGKVQIAAQELQHILTFLKHPSLVYTAKKFRKGEDLSSLSTIIYQAYGSIWRSLQYIAQSSFGTLGISEAVEGILRSEAQRIVSSESNVLSSGVLPEGR
ncbi:hypothetical protein F5050DRAFT_1730467 [Lentinula boryana]|uniref:Uncharacterized protein n=1 Tax=Lentinula boryana TaxID=40481 RepID=A0ABQ8QPE1_9AGAR|nr:hypothetical protein F5050DRAFT_1730467 [Lentinula boryana]